MKTMIVCAFLGICALAPGMAEDKPAAQVIVLANESTLRGQVQRIENAFHIRTEHGTTVLPANQVITVVASLQEAYAFLRNRANLRDPDERCRLARWCRTVGMEEEARIEVEVALALRPDHGEAQQLRAQLQQARLKALTPPVSKRDTASSKRETPSKPNSTATMEGWDHLQSGPLFVEYSRTIQPILFNGCGTGACHGKADKAPGGFVLYRPYDSGGVTPFLTRQNLAQTVALIDKKEPERSKLLKKALEPHGGSQRAPLGGKDTPAYRQLEAWHAKAAPASEGGGGVFASNQPERTQPKEEKGTKGENGPGFATGYIPGQKAEEAPALITGRKQSTGDVPGTQEAKPRRDAFGSQLPTQGQPQQPPEEKTRPPLKRPPWLQGRAVNAPKEPSSGTGLPAELPDWVTEPPTTSDDPYDPTPFNRHFHGRKEVKPQ